MSTCPINDIAVDNVIDNRKLTNVNTNYILSNPEQNKTLKEQEN
jgi:hypothetical protein